MKKLETSKYKCKKFNSLKQCARSQITSTTAKNHFVTYSM